MVEDVGLSGLVSNALICIWCSPKSSSSITWAQQGPKGIVPLSYLEQVVSSWAIRSIQSSNPNVADPQRFKWKPSKISMLQIRSWIHTYMTTLLCKGNHHNLHVSIRVMADTPPARAWSPVRRSCWTLTREKGKSSPIETAKQARPLHRHISAPSSAPPTTCRRSSHLHGDPRRPSLSPVPWRAACRISKPPFCNLKSLEPPNPPTSSEAKVTKMVNQRKGYSLDRDHFTQSSLWTRHLRKPRITTSSLKRRTSFRKTQRDLLANNRPSKECSGSTWSRRSSLRPSLEGSHRSQIHPWSSSSLGGSASRTNSYSKYAIIRRLHSMRKMPRKPSRMLFNPWTARVPKLKRQLEMKAVGSVMM